MEQIQAEEYYNSIIKTNSDKIQSLKKQIHLMGTIRLLLFIGWVVSLFILAHFDWVSFSLVSVLFFTPFIALMVHHNKLAQRKQYAETLLTLCANEIKVLHYDYSAFDDGTDRKDANHPFSLDLDLFGEQSFFQSINRTVTSCGYDKLVNWLLTPLTQKADILKRQEAVKELSEKTTLRQHFYVTGYNKRKEKGDQDFLQALMKRDLSVSNAKFWIVLAKLIPTLWVVLIGGLIFGLIDGAILVLFFILSSILANAKFKQVNNAHKTLESMQQIISAYADLIAIMEKEKFRSPMLTQLQEKLTDNQLTASQTIQELAPILKVLDQRGSMIGATFNIFTLREIHAIIRLDKWKQAHHMRIAQWFEALADFDALCSLSGFAFNNPLYIYPEIAEDYFTMSGKNLGHPLMDKEKCITNDINIEKHPYFLIITGANMAGKSTYLRTIGINFLLACMGAPACAKQLKVFPASIITSLRTSDSLKDNESYFYSELKRLKMIINRLQAGEKLFIILDEILKGTNSIDKQKGSLALIRQFVTYQTCGLIATHDLVLGSLQNEYPDNIKNYRFEADIKENDLTFSYKMKEGVAHNMNACFLMKKMGIAITE